MTDAEASGGSSLLERLAAGPVICAEGYLFELERSGYVAAGPLRARSGAGNTPMR